MPWERHLVTVLGVPRFPLSGPGRLKLRLRLAVAQPFRAAAALRGERLAGAGHTRQRGALGGEVVAGRGNTYC